MDIQEKWWHRFTKICLAGAVLLAALTVLAVSTTTWTPYGHQYSWEPGWDDAIPSKPCSVSLYSDNSGASVDCGGYFTPAKLFDALVEARLFLPTSKFQNLSEFEQGRSVADALQKLPQRYRSGTQFSSKNAWISVGVTLITLLILTALAWAAWRIFLYVAHGPGVRLTR